MDKAKIALLERYRAERAGRRDIIRVLFGFGKKPSLPLQPRTRLSQRTFAKLLLVHSQNATVKR